MHIIRTSHSIYKLQSVTSVTISDLVLSPNGLAGQQTIPDQTEIQSVNYVLIFFLPRDAMRKRNLCCRPVSLCPPVWRIRVLYQEGW